MIYNIANTVNFKMAADPQNANHAASALKKCWNRPDSRSGLCKLMDFSLTDVNKPKNDMVSL